MCRQTTTTGNAVPHHPRLRTQTLRWACSSACCQNLKPKILPSLLLLGETSYSRGRPRILVYNIKERLNEFKAIQVHEIVMKRLIITDSFYSTVSVSLKLLKMGLYHVETTWIDRFGWFQIQFTQKKNARTECREERSMSHKRVIILSSLRELDGFEACKHACHSM